MLMNKDEAIKLNNQLCFSIYSLSREINKLYRPFLEELNLTYTQYLVMLVLWEKESYTMRDLGDSLFLDSGTLSPVIKRLTERELTYRKRDPEDERRVLISLTDNGKQLKETAADIPGKLIKKSGLSEEEFSKTIFDFTNLLQQIQHANSE